MNGVEFLFALSAVIGMTTLHFLWIRMAYRLENVDKKKKHKPTQAYLKNEIVDDIIDYDGMGQGRFISENNRLRP